MRQVQYAETICWGLRVYVRVRIRVNSQRLVVQCLALGFSLQFT